LAIAFLLNKISGNEPDSMATFKSILFEEAMRPRRLSQKKKIALTAFNSLNRLKDFVQTSF